MQRDLIDYIGEASGLDLATAGRVAVIDHGKVIAEGTTGELKASVGSNSLHLRVLDAGHRNAAAKIVRDLVGSTVTEDADPFTVSARLDNPAQAAPILPALESAGIAIASFTLGQPSLDEVFLALTGHDAGAGVEPVGAKKAEIDNGEIAS